MTNMEQILQGINRSYRDDLRYYGLFLFRLFFGLKNVVFSVNVLKMQSF